MSVRLPSLQVDSQYQLEYQEEEHQALPHVFKFSGGRSSAMLLFTLLENRQLKARRGDVIVFNNTSAEHPSTYEFVRRCKLITEQRYKIPFFLTEFQTYEDAWLGRWRRAASYRLVKSSPHRNYSNRRSFGYRFKGEVFKEFISWNSQLPTRFSRTCTEYLKLQTSTRFLEDWFGRCAISKASSKRHSKEHGSTKRLGHFYLASKMPRLEQYGKRAEIVSYHFDQPSFREAQRFQDFTSVPLKAFSPKHIRPFVFDQKAQLRGVNPMRFLSIVGLRSDEAVRVARVLERNNTPHEKGRLADGEYVYAPLFDWDITKSDVTSFWDAQDFDLNIPRDVNLSNCVFCFMKGPSSIKELAQHSIGEGPSHIQWWADLETKYARSVTSKSDANQTTSFGFFGANAVTYQRLIDTKEIKEPASGLSSLPCECTD